MSNNIINVFLTESNEDNIIKLSDINPKIVFRGVRRTKPINEIIYVYQNLYMSVDTSTNKIKYECIETISADIDEQNENILCINACKKTVSQYCFPMINKYDDIITRTSSIYNNHIHVITDKYHKSGDKLVYLELPDDNKNLEYVLNALYKSFDQSKEDSKE